MCARELCFISANILDEISIFSYTTILAITETVNHIINEYRNCFLKKYYKNIHDRLKSVIHFEISMFFYLAMKANVFSMNQRKPWKIKNKFSEIWCPQSLTRLSKSTWFVICRQRKLSLKNRSWTSELHEGDKKWKYMKCDWELRKLLNRKFIQWI